MHRTDSNAPLLSICIATVGRADCLRETLRSIVGQIGSDAVEVVVVDGGSHDATEQVMQELTAGPGRMRYLRLAARGGVDEDFGLALELAAGEYCWFFCDDDLLEPGAIAAVCAALCAHAPELLVVNGKTWHAESGEVLQERRLRLAGDKAFDAVEAQELFSAVAHHVSYIGSVVIRRSLWMSRPREAYRGSEFAHVGVIFQAPLPGRALVLAEPWIRIRFMNHTWAPRAFKLWNVNWPRLIWSLEWVDESRRRAVVPRRPWRNTAMLVLARAKGHFGLEAYEQCILGDEPIFWRRAVARLVARIPRAPLRWATLACYRLLLPWRKMGILELTPRLDP
jgi:glycosyltransferase involved in cell wall biosynthesis